MPRRGVDLRPSILDLNLTCFSSWMRRNSLPTIVKFQKTKVCGNPVSGVSEGPSPFRSCFIYCGPLVSAAQHPKLARKIPVSIKDGRCPRLVILPPPCRAPPKAALVGTPATNPFISSQLSKHILNILCTFLANGSVFSLSNFCRKPYDRLQNRRANGQITYRLGDQHPMKAPQTPSARAQSVPIGARRGTLAAVFVP